MTALVCLNLKIGNIDFDKLKSLKKTIEKRPGHVVTQSDSILINRSASHNGLSSG